MLEYYAILCRRVSNCDGDNVSTTPAASANVDEVVAESQSETVVTPPDNMLAEEMAEGPQDFAQARAVNSIGDAVKAVSSGIHLQDARKMKLTPAAKQRQDIQNTMLSYIQRTATDADASDDELDLAFSSMAKRMRLHLSKTQKEQVLFKIQNVVGECINNVLEGNPINSPSQTNRPPVATNIMRANPPNAAAGDQLGFFTGQQQQPISYDATGEFSYQPL